MTIESEVKSKQLLPRENNALKVLCGTFREPSISNNFL